MDGLTLYCNINIITERLVLSFNQPNTPCETITSFLSLKADPDPRFVISDPQLPYI